MLSALAFEHADDASLCGVEHRAYELGLGPATVAPAALYRDFACEIRCAEIIHGQHDRTPWLNRLLIAAIRFRLTSRPRETSFVGTPDV